MQARCTVGVSRTVGALSDCHTAYREAIGVLAYPAGLGDGSSRFVDDLEARGSIRSDFTDAAARLESVVKSGSRARSPRIWTICSTAAFRPPLRAGNRPDDDPAP